MGCRPWVYRLAVGFGLTGFVLNDKQGVTIEAQGDEAKISQFVDALQNDPGKPVMMKIEKLSTRPIPVCPGDTLFEIRFSQQEGAADSQVCPDIATCPDCLRELNDPGDFRYRYPFINCTQCGPRYSIVQTIPYDRPNTTMRTFAMCPRCQSQYQSVTDRRFHAQPVACPDCGPKVSLVDNHGVVVETDSDKAISKTAGLLLEGKVLAIKGIGGFHLAVNALDDKAVRLLRSRKRREAKPLAMMAADIETIARYAVVDGAAVELLTGPASPIVLLTKKNTDLIAPSVAEGTHSFGFMLPYAPLHHLLFAEAGISVLIMTSANLSDEPLICDNTAAMTQLNGVADFFLVHDRPVYRQVDDSVAHLIDGKPALLRRSRGYVPEPILRERPAAVEIFAAGADLKNAFCFAKGGQYILSEHIGDLENPTVYRHYIRSIDHLSGLVEARPQVVVHDLHPGYFSTQYAREYAHQNGIKEVLAVQHHWAHAAAVMAEHHLSGQVIGLMADGTGYGTDGAIWGCECLICSMTDFTRFGHLEYYPLAGGDLASVEPIRPLLGLCKTSGFEIPASILERIETNRHKIELLKDQIDKQFLTVPTSSLGRFFDAAAALAGVGNYNHFEAQLPMAFEAAANSNENGEYLVQIGPDSNGTFIWPVRTVLEGLIDDVVINKSIDIIAARFHNTVSRAMLEFAIAAREKSGIADVALSGGVFCNSYLTNRLIGQLRENKFRVFWNQRVPAGDGCIALGQAAIACEKMKQRS